MASVVVGAAEVLDVAAVVLAVVAVGRAPATPRMLSMSMVNSVHIMYIDSPLI